MVSKHYFKEELHPKPKLSMFCALAQINTTFFFFFFLNNTGMLKQIVWETQAKLLLS